MLIAHTSKKIIVLVEIFFTFIYILKTKNEKQKKEENKNFHEVFEYLVMCFSDFEFNPTQYKKDDWKYIFYFLFQPSFPRIKFKS